MPDSTQILVVGMARMDLPTASCSRTNSAQRDDAVRTVSPWVVLIASFFETGHLLKSRAEMNEYVASEALILCADDNSG